MFRLLLFLLPFLAWGSATQVEIRDSEGECLPADNSINTGPSEIILNKSPRLCHREMDASAQSRWLLESGEGSTSSYSSRRVLNADSQFHHRLRTRARARHSALRRPAPRPHPAGSLFAGGGPDRWTERNGAARHGPRIQNPHHRSRCAYSRDLGRRGDSGWAPRGSAGSDGFECNA